ncbi:LOW QUALITY PROTEIN: hypothetical protein HZS_1320 [Henneguya salminicola]|nr:LOW QUALITY PROTEIN: hypothetical protein HZS_1320 [Henneguya salminicola]
MIYLLYLLVIHYSTNFFQSKKITILIYRSFYEKTLMPELGVKYCTYSSQFTILRSKKVLFFDIVILHFTEHKRFMKEYLATTNNSRKIMILFTFVIEPPFAVRTSFKYERSKDHFVHWVYSFYNSSFFYVPYGRYIKSKKSYYNERIIRREFRKRKNSAVAIISNCGFARSVRLRYITKLKKYFSVHTYGNCFFYPISAKDRNKILKSHKFLLSFENCNCEDYTTEKYWDGITNGAIPIVLGDQKNSTNLISASYINVFDYSHPKYLSKYLWHLSSNFKEFNKYYQWRRKYFAAKDRFSIDPCTILSKISNFLIGTLKEDDTIHKISSKRTDFRDVGFLNSYILYWKTDSSFPPGHCNINL